jgi:hypothetical protein
VVDTLVVEDLAVEGVGVSRGGGGSAFRVVG